MGKMTKRPTAHEGLEVFAGEPLARPDKPERKKPRRTPTIYLPGRNSEKGRDLLLRPEALRECHGRASLCG